MIATFAVRLGTMKPGRNIGRTILLKSNLTTCLYAQTSERENIWKEPSSYKLGTTRVDLLDTKTYNLYNA